MLISYLIFFSALIRHAFAAVTQAQIEACSSSITLASYMDPYTFDVNDKTQFSMVYVYDYSKCQNIPVASSRAVAFDSGTAYTCTYSQFSSSGTFTSVCQVTQGTMAITTRDTGTDWAIELKMGIKPTFYTREDIFGVDWTDSTTTSVTSTAATTTTQAATASGAVARKKREALKRSQPVYVLPKDSQGQVCEVGYNSCRMKDRKGYVNRCINTSRNLFACGGCVGDANYQDCSEIAGVANVQCVAGRCLIKTCDRAHKLSSDGTSCVKKEV